MNDDSLNDEFDFWIGEWELTWGENNHGTNRIEKVMGGAVIQENFETDGYQGLSVSVFSREDHRWHQTWVDSSGAYLDFTGDFTDSRMILARNGIVDGNPVKQRMIWYDIERDQFKWNWERSDDGGQNWQINWSIQYHRNGSARS